MNNLPKIITWKCVKTCSMLSVMIVSGVVVVMPMRPVSAQGITFDPSKIIAGTQNADAEAPDIVSSGKNVYIIWHEASPVDPNANIHEVWFSRSTDRGSNFSARKNVSNSVASRSVDEQIAVSKERNVYVVWHEEGTEEILFRRSTNAGSSFDSIKKLNTIAVPVGSGFPQLAASGDNVYVAWQAPGPVSEDVFFAESDDGGSNFDVEENISNPAAAANDMDSFDPEVAVSGNKVIVTWRDMTTPAGAATEIFYRQGK